MGNKDSVSKPWGGRFTQPTDAFVEAFTASVEFDKRLYSYDIQGSIAHARMLAHVAVISPDECNIIVESLQTIEHDIEQGTFQWDIALEDVHMNIEARLIALIGDTGKKLHTGRSRNDQVATDMRLYLRAEIDAIVEQLQRLQTNIVDLAEKHFDTIMPGFTHLQTAQPITFGHHMLAWFEMLKRDFDRLKDCRQRVNVMPLGAAALAGTSYPIDRQFCADLLGFAQVAENSLDAVSDRDFAIEFISCCSVNIMHLSRYSEELILWSSAQFDFIELGDSFCTGSSIMPQKKNPDVPELVRGKTGRIYGHLVALLTLMKGQPLAYNKDNQEDKEPLFDTIDNVKACLRVFADLIPEITVKPEKMHLAAKSGFSTATDLADYLVRKGIAFRDAHEIVGKAVHKGITDNTDLADMDLKTLKSFSKVIDKDVFDVLTLEGSVAARDHLGGTAPLQVKQAIARARQWLSQASDD